MDRVLFAPRELPPLGPDASQDVAAYSDWVRHREMHRASRVRPPSGRSVASLHLVLPALDAPSSSLRTALEGLGAQTSGHWYLNLVCAHDQLADMDDLVHEVLSRRQRRRVRTLGCSTTGPAVQVAAGLDASRGSPVALVFPGDVWAPDAVALLSASATARTVVYADHDLHDGQGVYRSPRLKPDYSPDFLLSSSYIGAPLVIGASVTYELPAPAGTSAGAVEHELALAACESADSVTHVAEVLCHRAPWDTSSLGSPATPACVRAALVRRNDPGEVEEGAVRGTYRIRRRTPARASVSIVIPFRDEPQLLRTCVDSVTATSSLDQTEFVLIDNGSTDPELLTLLERLDARADIRVLTDPRPFNWAALNNAAAEFASGDVLLFLNNDIEATRSGWLAALTRHACRPDVAAVGARLMYPDRRLQHCGVVVGLIGAAGHPLIGLSDGEPGYLDMALVTRECSAVTGACMATRKEIFAQLGGFDESLGIDLNDVDYCLRGYGNGYRTVYEPEAELIHHESPSRGTAGGASDIVRFIERWKDYIAAGDPYLNANITRSNPSCGLANSEEKERWNQWYSALSVE